jgi:hypothetical protein
MGTHLLINKYAQNDDIAPSAFQMWKDKYCANPRHEFPCWHVSIWTSQLSPSSYPYFIECLGLGGSTEAGRAVKSFIAEFSDADILVLQIEGML